MTVTPILIALMTPKRRAQIIRLGRVFRVLALLCLMIALASIMRIIHESTVEWWPMRLVIGFGLIALMCEVVAHRFWRRVGYHPSWCFGLL